jgi:hypothetical protein
MGCGDRTDHSHGRHNHSGYEHTGKKEKCPYEPADNLAVVPAVNQGMYIGGRFLVGLG